MGEGGCGGRGYKKEDGGENVVQEEPLRMIARGPPSPLLRGSSSTPGSQRCLGAMAPGILQRHQDAGGKCDSHMREWTTNLGTLIHTTTSSGRELGRQYTLRHSLTLFPPWST